MAANTPTAANKLLAAELRGTFVVVSDAVGFVGAFDSTDQARVALRPYLGVPFVYCEWKRREKAPPSADPDEEEDLVWILPYKANNAVACASNVKAVVETAQQELLRLDLVHGDDVKYWEAVVGTVITPAKLRLDDVVRAMHAAGDGEKADKDRETVSSFLDFASRHDAEEPARNNLLESVVPVALDRPPAAAAEAAGGDC